MVDVFRAQLDELMGKERNVPLSERSGRALAFDDPDVCKHQLAGLCPYQLFRNTRSDLGKCEYSIHEDHLEWPNIQEQYDQLSQREKDRLRYDDELYRLLDRLIRDMDKKIEKAKERAEAESRPKVLRPEDQKRLDEIQERIKDCQARAEQLGEQGDVDNALVMTNQADNYKRQYEVLHKQLTQPDRIMTVCDVCGVFISIADNEGRRLTPGELRAREDHLTGKQYLGWKKIRETFAEMKAKRAGGHRSSSRDYERSSSRDYDRGHDRGGRSYSREHGDRHRREGDDYDRHYRDRGQDRGGYRRDRERERERSPRRYGGGSSSRGRDSYDDRDYRRGPSGAEVEPPRELYGRPGRDSYPDDYDYRR